MSEWNGEGLPPVGCEARSGDDIALIKGYYGSQVWYQRQSGGDVVQMIEMAGFRPIRTEEDRMVNDMSNIARQFPEAMPLSVIYRAFYRAGYRKQ